MQKWEYLSIEKVPLTATNDPLLENNEILDDNGQEGWELVCTDDRVFYFKRPLPDYASTE